MSQITRKPKCLTKDVKKEAQDSPEAWQMMAEALGGMWGGAGERGLSRWMESSEMEVSAIALADKEGAS